MSDSKYSILTDFDIIYLAINNDSGEANISGLLEEIGRRVYSNDSSINLASSYSLRVNTEILSSITYEKVSVLDKRKVRAITDIVVTTRDRIMKNPKNNRSYMQRILDPFQKFMEQCEIDNILKSEISKAVLEFQKYEKENTQSTRPVLPSELNSLVADEYSRLLDTFHDLSEQDRKRLFDFGAKKYPKRTKEKLPYETVIQNLKTPTIPCNMTELLNTVLWSDKNRAKVDNNQEFLSLLEDWFYGIEDTTEKDWFNLISYLFRGKKDCLMANAYLNQFAKFTMNATKEEISAILKGVENREDFAFDFATTKDYAPQISINKDKTIAFSKGEESIFFYSSIKGFTQFLMGLRYQFQYQNGTVHMDENSKQIIKDPDSFVKSVNMILSCISEMNLSKLLKASETDETIGVCFEILMIFKNIANKIKQQDMNLLAKYISRNINLRYIRVSTHDMIQIFHQNISLLDFSENQTVKAVLAILSTHNDRINLIHLAEEEIKIIDKYCEDLFEKMIQSLPEYDILSEIFSTTDVYRKIQKTVEFYNNKMYCAKI